MGLSRWAEIDVLHFVTLRTQPTVLSVAYSLCSLQGQHSTANKRYVCKQSALQTKCSSASVSMSDSSAATGGLVLNDAGWGDLPAGATQYRV
jgi:hypothetical protein